ncbi:DUF6314 family protein [Albirhodobacter sp. R86504]|uniref:DUF6314 family protein n=1 Tax=Albirhodobacter sp. R86504 TaxID=3093848 RepID=UPI00366F6756
MGLSLDDFAGAWRLNCEIADHLTGQIAQFVGEGRLHLSQNESAVWLERGEMRIGAGPVMQAERRYLWAQDGARIHVSFGDGRPFHSFAPDGAPQAMHWCDPDDYRVRYDFTGWPTWRTTWRVKGPRKDYEMTTTATRP